MAAASPELVIQGEVPELLHHCHRVRQQHGPPGAAWGWYPRGVPPADLGMLLTVPDTQMFLCFICFQYQVSIQ